MWALRVIFFPIIIEKREAPSQAVAPGSLINQKASNLKLTTI